VCGFIGKVSFSKFDPEILNYNNKYIECRGPDSKVIESSFDSDLKHCFIFNRLSILDLSENANQPMISKNTGNYIMFNGEIFNHSELRKSLLNDGVNFHTNHSDTEVILKGIEHEGVKFISKLRGQFSIFYYDSKSRCVYLIRDRLGQKPLYYIHDSESISFSSNLVSLVNSNNSFKSLNESSIDEYLVYGVVASPKTIFNKFHKLEPATILKIEFLNNKLEISKNKYWEIEDYIDNKPFHLENFLSILEESVQTRAQADVPVASFLSGGLDSTTVTKYLSKIDQVNTFSIITDDQRYDESKWSNLASKKYNTRHQSVNISSRISNEDILSSLAALDEPYADPSVVPSYILAREIAKYFKVAISGDGGDELLGGYKRTLLTMSPKNSLESFISKFYNFYPGIFGSGSYFLSKSTNNQDSYRSTLADEKLMNLLNRNSKTYKNNIVLNENIDLYKSLLINDYKFYLSEQMLFKVDRTSMANSLEVRSPFLDHYLIQYIISHSTSYLDLNQQKIILKDLLRPDFSENFTNRKKQGFVFNLESWVYKNLEVINETFENGMIVGSYFENPIKKLSIYKSRINALRIWKLFTLENYLLQFNQPS